MYKGIEGYEDYKGTAERVETGEVMVAAIKEYDTGKSDREEKNTELDTLISDFEILVSEGGDSVRRNVNSGIENQYFRDQEHQTGSADNKSMSQ